MPDRHAGTDLAATGAARSVYVAEARARARLLYLGDEVAHRSCGIALAEVFGLPSASYQALRKGGLTGLGPCGALQAGVLVLGEILGDPDPTGMPTPELRAAIPLYQRAVEEELGSMQASCAARTAPFPDFAARARLESCTGIAEIAAGCVAGVLFDAGRARPIPPRPSR